MFKTRDNQIVTIGMWVSDGDGIYEVREIRKNSVIVREVFIGENDKYEYNCCDDTLSPKTISNMWYM